MKNRFTVCGLAAVCVFFAPSQALAQNFNESQLPVASDAKIKPFEDVTLEVSLKPFKKNDPAYTDAVCREIFAQWAPLLRHAKGVSVMIWVSDGSDILEYTGDLAQPLEWAKYLGNPNTEHPVNSGPENLTLHQRAYEYMEAPPAYSYADLKAIVSAIKKIGEAMTGKPVRAGATFDPGPEFAKSKFKYLWHPEICMGNSMGKKTFVCCYATLKADTRRYAAFPNGIEEGTPFGAFLGGQSLSYMKDLGFDYIWFSNGLGFGLETWHATGAIFDGKTFDGSKIADTNKLILRFWDSFRKQNPSYRVETRGTNMSVGIDLAGDGVNLRELYSKDLNFAPPPNSPWAAMDGNFGLELVGYMSRMAELPKGESYVFRFYAHDPWWANSPWLDRYGREAQDIYLPLAVARFDANVSPQLPARLNILSIDDSYGNMPLQVPDEIILHILQARRLAPDAPPPLLWVYPFDEYHDAAFKDPTRLPEIYFGDWFITQAVNDGLPLSGVISSRNFISAAADAKLKGSVLVSVVPDAESPLESALTSFIKGGGNVILYGPAAHASAEFLKLLNLKIEEPLEGVFEIDNFTDTDAPADKVCTKLKHEAVLSGGGIETVLENPADKDTRVIAAVSKGGAKRIAALVKTFPQYGGARVSYVRGTNSGALKRLLTPDDIRDFYLGARLMRAALAQTGLSVKFEKRRAEIPSPVNMISRNENAYVFSGYNPNQTTSQLFRSDLGAPLFIGVDAELKDGYAAYNLPRSYQEECRVFVSQQCGLVICKEEISGVFRLKRRLGVYGLDKANVRVYAGLNPMREGETFRWENSDKNLRPEKVKDATGEYYLFKNVSGILRVGW